MAKLESVEACRSILSESYRTITPERRQEVYALAARSLPSVVEAVMKARTKTDEGIENAIDMTKGSKIAVVAQCKSEEEGSILQRLQRTVNAKNLIGMTMSRMRREQGTTT